MKKFVSAIAALAVVGAMAVPAMAATNEEVINAVKAAGADASQVTATQTYLNTVKLGEGTLDTVLANVNAAKAAKDAKNMGKVKALADSTIATVNADPAAKGHELSLNMTKIGDVMTVAIVSNVATAGADINTKTGAVGAVNSMNGTTTGGVVAGSTGSKGVIKATGANMNLTAAISAALAMVASMGAAVVYGVKKGLLAK